MDFYLAARYSRRLELCGYRKQLEDLRHTVTSRWLHGNHQADDDTLGSGGAAERFATEDIHDLMRAQIVISFTEHPRSSKTRGGRHVEFGVALATRRAVWIVGPRENVFHCLSHVRQFDTFDQLIAVLSPKHKHSIKAKGDRSS